MFFFGERMEPAIKAVDGDSMIGECGVCDETCWVVATDTATGIDICQECVHDSLTVDYFLVKNYKRLRIRHPRPKEFMGKKDH